MVTAHLHLTLPGALRNEPVVAGLGSRFGLTVNIRRAHIEEPSGWVILEVKGGDAHVEQAISWLEERGVAVDRLEAPEE